MERIIHYFYDVIAANGFLWLLEYNMNALFKMDIKTSKLEFVSSFPNESAVPGLYNFQARYGNKLVCCPRNARMIVVYDIDSGNMDTIGVDFGRHKGRGAGMYGEGAVGSKAYLLRQGYSEIYQLDVQSGELTTLNVVNRETELRMNDYFWHGRILKYKSDAAIILYNTKYKAFYQYNVLTSETKKIICLEENQQLDAYVTDGHFIWGLCSDGRLYKWDGVQVIDECHCDTTGIDLAELIYCKKRIYIVDAVAGRIISSLGTNADEGENISKKMPDNNTGLYMYRFKDDYFWMQWKDGLFYYYDGVNEVSGIFESDLGNIPAEAFLPKEMITEKNDFSLQKLLKIIKYQPDVFKNDSVGNVGINIYNTIMTD